MIRLSEAEYSRLEAYAQRKDVSMAKVLRDYIKRLPNLSTMDKDKEN